MQICIGVNAVKRIDMSMKLFVVFALCVPCLASAAHAKTCLRQEAEAADAAIDGLDSWVKVDQVFRKFDHCDDGSIAEGYSEAVARLLIDKWNTLPQLARLIKRNPALQSFVLQHVDETLDSDDLGKIKRLAASACPPGMTRLCARLQQAASDVLSENLGRLKLE